MFKNIIPSMPTMPDLDMVDLGYWRKKMNGLKFDIDLLGVGILRI